ncbi:MAG: hypothetical protein J6J42_03920 [Lachnospiraceae bacterium]|nr:hypothetical protein [Lachnospiraceae bacterium]
MNEIYVKGTLLNTPRYDIIPITSDAIVRVLVSVEGTVLPVVCCNEMACSARELLLEADMETEVFFAGRIKGNSYTDAVGSQNYLLYLIADRVALSEADLRNEPGKKYTPLQYDRLPFSIADLEDILMYME